jgi:hypothetical protein
LNKEGGYMNKDLLSKILVMGVVLFFIGIGVSPGINARTQIEVNEEVLPNNELSELIVSYCKFDEIENFTVEITRQQVDELDILINEFKGVLDSAKTLEETIVIYNEMLNSLLELGFLPDGVDYNEIKMLISDTKNSYESLYINPQTLNNKKIKSRLIDYDKNPGLLDVEDDENFLCLISGETDDSHFRSLPALIRVLLGIVSINIIYSYLPIIFPFIVSLFERLGIDWYDNEFWQDIINYIISDWPTHIGGITFGHYEYDILKHIYLYPVPAKGWVNTFGLLGKKIWDGKYYGQLKHIGTLFEGLLYQGVSGFSGIRIKEDYNDQFFIGFAVRVKLGPDIPYDPLKGYNIKTQEV